MALGASVLQRITLANQRPHRADAEVPLPERTTPRDISLDLLQPQHAPDRRSARPFLHRTAAARISRSRTLAHARPRHPRRATAATRPARRRLLRAVDLLPPLHD